MRYLPDAKQMKTADSFTINELKIPSLELMERAARACVDHIKDWKINLNKICVLCGSGNNGGDGFAIARMFAWEGCDVSSGRKQRSLHTRDCLSDRTVEKYRSTV